MPPPFLPAELLRAKRDGAALSPADITAFVAGLADGSVSEAQAGAFAMAACINGLDEAETVALTAAMANSGERMTWDLPGPVLDKHSTGGVGDAVSLVLAPMLAACGAYVPSVAGRGLGHTGGTVDKLEAIPGYDTAPDEARLRATLARAGLAIVGQSAALAPADGRLYAVRDATGTVESVPLITASILSKKLAAGLGGLVMDVKCGEGAFMPDLAAARTLAASLARVAAGAGLPLTALVTDMDEPLAPCAGNAIEVAHAVALLRGEAADPRMMAVTRALGAAALRLGGLAADEAGAFDKLDAALASGAAAERFGAMAAMLGGPADFVERPAAHLPVAPVTRPVPASEGGWVARIGTRDLGLAVVRLGGGRARPGERIDPRVGLTGLARIGTRVEAGDPLALVHAADENAAEAAVEAVARAYVLMPARVLPRPVLPTDGAVERP